MADDGAEVEKKKPDLPSKTPKPNSVSAKVGGGGGIVLALVKLKKRKQGEERNVKKKKRILNEKSDEGEEGKPNLPSKTPKPNSMSAKAGGGGGIVLALVKLKKRKQGEEGNVKKKKRILNEKGEEGSDDLWNKYPHLHTSLLANDLPEDVKEGAMMMLGKVPEEKLEREWSSLMKANLEFFMKGKDLIVKKMKLALDGLKSQDC